MEIFNEENIIEENKKYCEKCGIRHNINNIKEFNYHNKKIYYYCLQCYDILLQITKKECRMCFFSPYLYPICEDCLNYVLSECYHCKKKYFKNDYNYVYVEFRKKNQNNFNIISFIIEKHIFCNNCIINFNIKKKASTSLNGDNMVYYHQILY